MYKTLIRMPLVKLLTIAAYHDFHLEGIETGIEVMKDRHDLKKRIIKVILKGDPHHYKNEGGQWQWEPI